MIDFREDIQQALEVLRRGGVILYPTDTIWGIGCDATNAQAVDRVYEIKKRAESKSMLVLLENINMLPSYVDDVPDVAWDLIEFSVKPTTIVFDKGKNLASNVLADDGSIGIRITSEEFSAQLIRRFRKPIVSTSANISGEASPQNFSEISSQIVQAVDYVVKFRQNELQTPQPSSIIKLGSGGLVKVIRP